MKKYLGIIGAACVIGVSFLAANSYHKSAENTYNAALAKNKTAAVKLVQKETAKIKTVGSAGDKRERDVRQIVSDMTVWKNTDAFYKNGLKVERKAYGPVIKKWYGSSPKKMSMMFSSTTDRGYCQSLAVTKTGSNTWRATFYYQVATPKTGLPADVSDWNAYILNFKQTNKGYYVTEGKGVNYLD